MIFTCCMHCCCWYQEEEKKRYTAASSTAVRCSLQQQQQTDSRVYTAVCCTAAVLLCRNNRENITFWKVSPSLRETLTKLKTSAEPPPFIFLFPAAPPTSTCVLLTHETHSTVDHGIGREHDHGALCGLETEGRP